jgi:hypothetical protein
MLSSGTAALAAPVTLCHADETSYFTCTMGPAHKIASLCGHEAEPRYLQYRFGRAGQSPELQVPASTSDSAMGTTFFHEAERRADGKLTSDSVWFRHADTIYELEYVVTEDEDIGPEFADILLFQTPSTATPRGLSCASAAGAKSLANAFDLIDAMSPPGRVAQGSPWDARIADERAAAAKAASAAKR